MQWVLAAILISGASVFTSCTSDNDDNSSPKSGANSELVGQWYSDVSGATYAAWTYGKAWQQTELKADGTGVTNIYYLNNDDAVAREHYSFTYTATDGLLTMDIAERNTKTTARYTVSEGKLLLTEGVDAIIGATKRLADRLVALYPTQREAIDKATKEVYRFSTYIKNKQSPDESIGYFHITPFFDLADYAHLLAKETGDAEMTAISSDLDKAFSEAFVHYADVSTNEQHLDHYTLSVCLVNEENYEGNNKDPELIKAFVPNALCKFDQGYEQTTFHKLTGWGNWLRTNQQLLWDNPTSNGGGPLK